MGTVGRYDVWGGRANLERLRESLSHGLEVIELPAGTVPSATWAALALGAISGVRSMAGPAALTRELARRGKGRYAIAARCLAAAATLEMGADKLPSIPARTSALPLAGRALSGAACGLLLPAKRHEHRLTRALLGAAAAVASAFAMVRVRRFLMNTVGLPNAIAGAIEDAAVVGSVGGISRLLRS